MDHTDRVTMSRRFALALRHQAISTGLEPDPGGWVEVDRFIERWQRKGGPRSLAEIEEVVAASGRYQLSDDRRRIRARYGHSFPVELGFAPQQPPARLYHATYRAAWRSIAAQGLVAGRRQHVHLAHTLKVAQRSARRHHDGPIIVVVDAAAVHAHGGRLLRANDEVWLAEHVAPRYLQLHPDSVAVVQIAPVPKPPPRTEEQLAAATADWLRALPPGTEVGWGADTEAIAGRWVTGPDCLTWVEGLGQVVGLSWVWIIASSESRLEEEQTGGPFPDAMHVTVPVERTVRDAAGDEQPAWSAERLSAALRDWSRARGVEHVTFRFDPDHPPPAFLQDVLQRLDSEADEGDVGF